MSGPRTSHVQKTQSDRERYYRNTVKRTPSPTLEEPLIDADSTIATAPADTALPNRYVSTRSRPSPLGQHLREKWPEILIGLIGVPVVAFLLWQTFTLNREVGELRMQLTEIQNQGKRLENQIEKLNDRIDRFNQAPEAAPKK
jgi:hypothetical protein